MTEAVDYLSSLGIAPSEAELFFTQHHKQTIVIKLGGNVFADDDDKKQAAVIKKFAQDIVCLKKTGARPIIVHGGGPTINKKLEQAKIEIKFVSGLRYTDMATLNIVKTAMADINYKLCRAIERAGGIPLPHPDKLVMAKKFVDKVDLGWVGEAVALDNTAAASLLDDETIPIISPIGFDTTDNHYNINGDNFAGFIAAALQAERFLLMTNVAGVWDKEKNLIVEINVARAEELMSNGTIHGGMIPKIKTALSAVKNGVKAVAIIDGRIDHAVLRELFTAQGNGTLIKL